MTLGLYQSLLTVAGNSKTFTVGAGQTIQITGVFAHLAASSTVGNRLLEVQVLDASSNLVWDTRAAYNQSNSSDQFLSGVPGGTFFADQNNQRSEVALPNPFILSTGYTIKVYDRANIDAVGDTLEVDVMWFTRERLNS